MAGDFSPVDWPQRIFVERPELFLPFLESFKERAEEEVESLDTVMRERGVAKGGRVLDLACGIGRHSVPLAKRGYVVTGVDLSPTFIQHAREYAEAEEVSDLTSFFVGDMRQIRSVLEGKGLFDATLNMWTAMGYYGEDVDREVLQYVADSTAVGGLLLIETANKDGILRVFQERGWNVAGDLVQLERRRFDSDRSHMVDEWTFYRRMGKELTYLASGVIDHRIYSAEELAGLAMSAGWIVEGVYAGLKLEPLDPDSPDTRMFLVARRG